MIAALIVLVILSGLFSATETAYSCMNKIKLKSMGKNVRAQKTLALGEKFEGLLTAILIGNNIANLSAAAISGLLFAKWLQNFSVDPSVISTIVLTVVILIFGEITPKFFAKSFPEKFAMVLYPFAIATYYFFFPLTLLFRGYQKLISKILKIDPDDTITDEQLLTIVDEAEEDGTLKKEESNLLRSALEFDDLEVGDILIPRVEVEAVPIDSDMEEIAKVFRETGYSRLIVYKDTIDNVLGFVHQKDFYIAYLDKKKSVQGIVQTPNYTAEHTRISVLLKQLQAKRGQIAVVTDEYGGMLGIVTLEDILEELVGEIYDENDEEEVPFVKKDDGSFVIEGFCETDVFFQALGFETETESNTFGGWLTEQFGQIPNVGRKIAVQGYEFKVLKASKKRVYQALATPMIAQENTEKVTN